MPTPGRPLVNPNVPLDELLWEPFYQIMRMRLLADRAVREGVTDDVQVDEAKVVVICPKGSAAYRTCVASRDLARRFPTCRTVEAVVRATLKDPAGFAMVAPGDLVAALRSAFLQDPRLKPWLEYQRARYGW